MRPDVGKIGNCRRRIRPAGVRFAQCLCRVDKVTGSRPAFHGIRLFKRFFCDGRGKPRLIGAVTGQSSRGSPICTKKPPARVPAVLTCSNRCYRLAALT
jgi:hypothetical protein